MNDKMNWKNVLTIGGAYTAYCIGAGFASGQETLQYYASWGGIYPFVLPALTFVLMFVICYGTFKTGYINRFPSPNAAYGYYCGKVLGKILDIFCTVSIALSTLIMFAGSGATVNQYLGAPVWVGTLVMGVVSVVVVCFGLEKVTNVLGFVGTLIIVILIGVGIYCFCTADSGVMQAQQNVQQYVDAGVIMRANFLGIENPILAVTSLIGAYITLGLSFNVSLGGRCGSRREVSASAVISAVLFCLGLCMVLFTIIFNMDYIAQTGAQIPMLAAIQNMLPGAGAAVFRRDSDRRVHDDHGLSVGGRPPLCGGPHEEAGGCRRDYGGAGRVRGVGDPAGQAGELHLSADRRGRTCHFCGYCDKIGYGGPRAAAENK